MNVGTSKVVLCHPNAIVPSRAEVKAGEEPNVGYDILLTSIKEVKRLESDSPEGEFYLVMFGTGVKIQPPQGYYYQLLPRSSFSKSGFRLANSVGIIDAGYTGEIMVPLIPNNQKKPSAFLPEPLTEKDAERRAGDWKAPVDIKPQKWFQLVLTKRLDSTFEVTDSLDVTSRGDGGFGSTDAKNETEIFEDIIKKLWKKQHFTSLDIVNFSGENREEFAKYIEANFTQHFLLKNYKRQLIIEPAEFRSVLSYVKYTKEPLQVFNKTLWKNKRKEYEMDRLQLPLDATSLFNCSSYSHMEIEEEILLYPDEKGPYKRWRDGRLVFYPNNVVHSKILTLRFQYSET